MHPSRQAIWGYIWKCTLGKSQTNATNVIMPHLVQVIRGHIWKHTVEKNQINATNVIMPHLRQAIWGHILKRTVEKSQTNATNVTMPHIAQAIWGNIWKHTVVQQMQPMWFCILTSRQFQETFDNAQKKKRNKCNQLIPQSSYTLFLFWANQWFYLVSLVQKIGDPSGAHQFLAFLPIFMAKNCPNLP